MIQPTQSSLGGGQELFAQIRQASGEPGLSKTLSRDPLQAEMLASTNYGSLTAIQRIRHAHDACAGRVILTTSGGETSAVMPHLMASAIGSKDFLLVFVDHGFYTSATYRMVDYFRKAGYNLKTYRSPLTPGEIERDYSGWCDPRTALFSTVVRKIKHTPLNRAFAEFKPKAWIRGIMRHETPERQTADFVQFKNGVYQVHPILDWCRGKALDYLAEHDLPINEDHWDPTKGRDQRGECLIGDNCGVKSDPLYK